MCRRQPSIEVSIYVASGYAPEAFGALWRRQRKRGNKEERTARMGGKTSSRSGLRIALERPERQVLVFGSETIAGGARGVRLGTLRVWDHVLAIPLSEFALRWPLLSGFG